MLLFLLSLLKRVFPKNAALSICDFNWKSLSIFSRDSNLQNNPSSVLNFFVWVTAYLFLSLQILLPELLLLLSFDTVFYQIFKHKSIEPVAPKDMTVTPGTPSERSQFYPLNLISLLAKERKCCVLLTWPNLLLLGSQSPSLMNHFWPLKSKLIITT